MAKYDVAFKGGKLVAKLEADPAAGLSAEVMLSVDAAVVIDALAKAIPGTLDDLVLGLVKEALLK